MIVYLGLISVVFFVTMVVILDKCSPEISLKKRTISILATAKDRKIRLLFNTSLLLFALGQTVFAVYASNVLVDNWVLPSIFFLLGGIFLVLASFYTENNYPMHHRVFSAVSAFIVTMGVLMLALLLLTTTARTLGAILLGMSILLVPSGYMSHKKLKGSLWEVVLFSGIGISDLIITILLLI